MSGLLRSARAGLDADDPADQPAGARHREGAPIAPRRPLPPHRRRGLARWSTGSRSARPRPSSRPTCARWRATTRSSASTTVLSGNLPRRALLITFDDGYRSFVDVALPILRRLGLPSVLFVTGACLEPYSLPLDNLLSYLCAAVGLERLGAALDPTAARPATFLTGPRPWSPRMPYDRRLVVGDELAERFEIDQARLRADSGIFLDRGGPRADWRQMDVRSRTTLAHTSSAGRSSTRHPRTINSSSMLDGSNR